MKQLGCVALLFMAFVFLAQVGVVDAVFYVIYKTLQFFGIL